MFSLRFLKAILDAALSLVLGISALVVIWFLFFALLGLLNPNWAGDASVTVIRPPPEGWLYSSLHEIFDTWVVLLGMAAPIWILAWLPLYLVRSRRSPWRISKTIFVAALVGGVGGAIECVLVFLHYVGPLTDPRYQGPPLFMYAGACFVIGAIGRALIGAAEIAGCRWFVWGQPDSGWM